MLSRPCLEELEGDGEVGEWQEVFGMVLLPTTILKMC